MLKADDIFAPMQSPAERIREAAEDEKCPQCLVPLGRHRTGSGRLADGVFCSLDCYAVFHEDHFTQRLKLGVPSRN